MTAVTVPAAAPYTVSDIAEIEEPAIVDRVETGVAAAVQVRPGDAPLALVGGDLLALWSMKSLGIAKPHYF